MELENNSILMEAIFKEILTKESNKDLGTILGKMNKAEKLNTMENFRMDKLMEKELALKMQKKEFSILVVLKKEKDMGLVN